MIQGLNMQWSAILPDDDRVRENTNCKDRVPVLCENNTFDEDRYDLIRDMYYPLSRQMLDKTAKQRQLQKSEVEEYAKQIQKVDLQHENTMIALKFLWNEIYEGLEKLEKFQEKDYFIFNHSLRWGIDHVFLNLDYYYEDSPEEANELAHILIDVKYIFRFRTVPNHFFQNNWSILWSFRNKAFSGELSMDRVGIQIWLLLLILLYSYGDKELNIFKEVYCQINFRDFILTCFSKIQKRIFNHQKEQQRSMFTLCYCIVAPSDDEQFDRNTEFLVNILKRIPVLNDMYLVKNDCCFAVMDYKGKEYFALSGKKEHYKNDPIIEEVKKKYKRVCLNNDMRYYYSDSDFITYGQYLDVKEECKSIKDINIKGRMFSCCERKFLTILPDPISDNTYKIYSRLIPCYMCKRAFLAYDNDSEKNFIYYQYDPASVFQAKQQEASKIEYDMKAKQLQEQADHVAQQIRLIISKKYF